MSLKANNIILHIKELWRIIWSVSSRSKMIGLFNLNFSNSDSSTRIKKTLLAHYWPAKGHVSFSDEAYAITNVTCLFKHCNVFFKDIIQLLCIIVELWSTNKNVLNFLSTCIYAIKHQHCEKSCITRPLNINWFEKYFREIFYSLEQKCKDEEGLLPQLKIGN